MSLLILVLLLGCSTYVFSSPLATASNNNAHRPSAEESPGLVFDTSDEQAAAAALGPVQEHSIGDGAPIWYVQPRAHANQFLLSHLNENDGLLPQWFSRVHSASQTGDLSLDADDYLSSSLGLNKRSTFVNQAGLSHLKKRKQLTKPPMEVMNEIVNSIYLKRR